MITPERLEEIKYLYAYGEEDAAPDESVETKRRYLWQMIEEIERLQHDSVKERDLSVELDRLDKALLQRDNHMLRVALEACDLAFVNWQIGQIPARPEGILTLIKNVRDTLNATVTEPAS